MVSVDLWKLAASCSLAAVLLTPGLRAQAVAVAEVDGVVTDASGKVMPGVPVVMTQTDTQAPHNSITDAEGRYHLGNLPPGPYSLEVRAPGFKDYRQTGIVLEVGHTGEINVTLSVGAVTETIEVSADASMVETKDSAIAQVMDQRKLVDLPLNGRNLTQLLTFVGGGTTTPGGDLTGSKNIQGSNGSGTFSVAGGIFTRLTPPLIPKRENSRLKCAFTVRRAIFSCLEISSLSQPCRSSSTTCCSRGRSSFSFIKSPSYWNDLTLVPSRKKPALRGCNLVCTWCASTPPINGKLIAHFG